MENTFKNNIGKYSFENDLKNIFGGSDGVFHIAIRHQNSNADLIATPVANRVAFQSADSHILDFYFSFGFRRHLINIFCSESEGRCSILSFISPNIITKALKILFSSAFNIAFYSNINDTNIGKQSVKTILQQEKPITTIPFNSSRSNVVNEDASQEPYHITLSKK